MPCYEGHYHHIPSDYVRDRTQPFHENIGQKVDEYLIVDTLGEGGFGRVFLALQLPLGMQVAIKLLAKDFPEGPLKSETMQQVKSEAHALAQLRHPNIVRLHKYGVADNVPYMVMEYVAGGRTLREEIQSRVREGRPLSMQEANRILHQLLDGLEAAHGKGLLHLDIKPENIMLQTVSGNPYYVRIVDFGLARSSDEATAAALVGTPIYMAPEQFKGGPLGPWTDLYAIGVLAFELISGQRAFGHRDHTQVMACKLDPDYRPTSALDADLVSQELIDFVFCALEPNHEARFQDVEGFRMSLRSLSNLLEASDSDAEFVDLVGLLSEAELAEIEAEQERLAEERTRIEQDRDKLVSERRELTAERLRLGAVSAGETRTVSPSTTNRSTATMKRVSLQRQLQYRIIGLVSLSLLLLGGVVFYVVSQSNATLNDVLRDTLEQRYRSEIRNQTQALISSFKSLPQEEGSAEWKSQVRRLGRETKYNGARGYFFMYDRAGVVVAHGNDPTREGEDYWQLKGPSGRYIIRELHDAARRGGGFVSYHWAKPGESGTTYPKLGYAQNVPSTDWWVGTGVYLDDVDYVIAAQAMRQDETLELILLDFTIVAVAVLCLALFIGWTLGARISRPIIAISETADRMSRGDFDSVVNTRGNDEVADLAIALNRMGASVSATIQNLVTAKRHSTAIVRSVADGIVLTDAENTIVEVNPAAETIFGYEAGELIGQPLNILLPTELQQAYQSETLEAVWQGETVVNHDIRRQRKDGTPVVLTVAVGPLKDEDGIVQFRVHSVSDRTEHIQLKQHLSSIERLRPFVPYHAKDAIQRGEDIAVNRLETRFVSVLECRLPRLVHTGSVSSSGAKASVTTPLEFPTHITRLVKYYDAVVSAYNGESLQILVGATKTLGEASDAKRCIRLAESILDSWPDGMQGDEEPSGVTIGIDTGVVHTGFVGTNEQVFYAALGEPVLRSRKLAKTGLNGEIRITEATWRLLDGEISIRETKPSVWKDQEVRLFQVNLGLGSSDKTLQA